MKTYPYIMFPCLYAFFFSSADWVQQKYAETHSM